MLQLREQHSHFVFGWFQIETNGQDILSTCCNIVDWEVHHDYGTVAMMW